MGRRLRKKIRLLSYMFNKNAENSEDPQWCAWCVERENKANRPMMRPQRWALGGGRWQRHWRWSWYRQFIDRSNFLFFEKAFRIYGPTDLRTYGVRTYGQTLL